MQRLELKPGIVLDRITKYNNKNPENKIEITGNQAKPSGLYRFHNRNNREIMFSGFGSRDKDGKPIIGCLDSKDEKAVGNGKQAARGACLNFLNNVATACQGDLEGIISIEIRVDVNCDTGFEKHPAVADGASQLLEDVFGPLIGKPVRTTAGAPSLPNKMTVEITGKIHITKELAKTLDLRDAENLAAILSKTNQLQDSQEDFISKFDQVEKLTKNDKFQLYECVETVIKKLKNSTSIDQEKIKTNAALIDEINWRAKTLNLTKNKENETLSFYSLFGSITKEKATFVVGALAIAAATGYVLGKGK